MRLVLIQPPIEDFYTTQVRLQPIGLAYLKAVVRANFPEVEVVIRDYHAGFGKRSIAWPKELLFLKDYYPFADHSPFSTFYHYYHFGASYEAIVEDVARLNADVVGISVLFSAYAPQAFALARRLKEKLGVTILLGGSHVSALPEEVLSLPFVDFVIFGEGERPLAAFVEAFLGKKRWDRVPNLVFKQNGRLKFTEAQDNFSLDDLPFPDFSDFDRDHYRLGARRLSFLLTSRSCPYRCAFCSVHQTFGRRFRLRSVENIVAELLLRREQGYSAFDFEDDNFTYDGNRLYLLLRTLRETFASDEVRLAAMNGIAYFRLSGNLLKDMYSAGFRDLNISLVSRNEKLLRKLKRPYHFERFEEIVRLADSLQMRVVSYQILGLPGDSVPSMLETLIYQSRLPLIIGVSPFYYTAGMPVGRREFMEKPFWVLGRLTSLGIGNNPAERENIYTLFILARMVNFLKQLSGVDHDVCLRDLLDGEENWQGRERLGLQILKRLFANKRLFGFTGKEFKPLPKFRYDLFWAFLEQAGHVQRPGGKIIRLTDCG